MFQQATFTNWDFNTIWIQEDYPELQWVLEQGSAYGSSLKGVYGNKKSIYNAKTRGVYQSPNN
jgi:hypothetical protein